MTDKKTDALWKYFLDEAAYEISQWPEDVAMIQRAAHGANLRAMPDHEMTLEEAAAAWSAYSDLLDAGWIMLADDPDWIVECLRKVM